MANVHKHADIKEPFVRIKKRDDSNLVNAFLIRAGFIVASFVLILLLLALTSRFALGNVIKYFIDGSFASNFSQQTLMTETFMLLGISVALAPAFKMKFWNIGAQGQVLMGALVTAISMKYFVPAIQNNFLLIVIMFVLSVLAGGIWGMIPAIFKNKINANETLFTLMMNYIAIQIVKSFYDMWKGRLSALPKFNTDTKLGYLFMPTTGNPYLISLLVVAVIAVFIFIYMKYTKHGYELSVVGESMNTAKYAGINTSKVVLRTMFLSGAICGIIGFLYVAGITHSISENTGGSYGFTAIIIAWSSKFNPFVMFIVSLLYTFIDRGACNVINNASYLTSINNVCLGIFLFILISCEFLINYKLVFNEKITTKNQDFKNKVQSKMPKTTAFFKKFNGWTGKLSDLIISAKEKVNHFMLYIVHVITSAVSNFFKGLFKKNKTMAKTVEREKGETDSQKVSEAEPIEEEKIENADSDAQKEANNG